MIVGLNWCDSIGDWREQSSLAYGDVDALILNSPLHVVFPLGAFEYPEYVHFFYVLGYDLSSPREILPA